MCLAKVFCLETKALKNQLIYLVRSEREHRAIGRPYNAVICPGRYLHWLHTGRKRDLEMLFIYFIRNFLYQIFAAHNSLLLFFPLCGVNNIDGQWSGDEIIAMSQGAIMGVFTAKSNRTAQSPIFRHACYLRSCPFFILNCAIAH